MTITRRARYVLFGVTAVVLIVATVFELRVRGGSDAEDVRGHLGPTPGPASTQGYVKEKRTYLESLAAREPATKVAALISFKSYVPAPSVQRLVEDMRPTFVWARFPTTEAEPLRVTTTVAGAVADRAATLRKALDAELKDLQAQGEQADAEQKAALVPLVADLTADLAKVGADCGCVFAVSVEDARMRDLEALLSDPAVRIVDVPDPPTNDLGGWELQPFVPKAK
jgi:hypothetical protein